MFDDFDRYAKVPDEYAAPAIKEYSPTVSRTLLMLVKHAS
jgi:hypothetical protein